MTTITATYKQRPHDVDFDAAFRAFEEALAAPLVSGEVDLWIGELKTGIDAVSEQLTKVHGDRHEKVFSQIEEEDAEMITTADGLRSEDQKLREDLERFRQQVHALSRRQDSVEPDERERHRLIPGVVKIGTELAARLRQQEMTIRQWFSEAMYRERGVID